ncbi:MAG: hypothetical protein OXR82_08945 [Gammaproteobacteria bacterium]|nr:hypothetical protein [Gammaproteobacteria bacterium]
MIGTPKGLATLALLKTRFDEGRDHLELVEPFVGDAVIHCGQDSFLPQDIASQVLHRSGLVLPSDTVKTVLGRFSRRGKLRREGGRFFYAGGLADPGLDEVRSNQEAKNEILAGAFSGYADKQGVLLRPDEALTVLAQFITDNKAPLLLEQGLPGSSRHGSALDRRISRLVAAFITEEALESENLAARLQALTEGLVLKDTLLLQDVSFPSQRFRNLTVLLDTPILLSVLGLNGEANRLATAEFLSLIREAGAITAAFDPTVSEIRRILAVYEDRLGRPGGHLELYPTELTNHILTQRMAPSDIRTISAMLERHLSRLAIQVRKMPNRDRRFTLDETVLAEALAGETDNSETPRIRHDVDVIASTLTLRRGRIATSIERAGAVFCTTSGMVIKKGQQWYRDQGEAGIPPIVHQYALSSIAWFKKPQAAYGIKMHELAALCRSALRPNRETWGKFIVNLRELCDNEEITSDETVAVVASELTEPLLARVEDSGEPDADTIHEAIERVIGKYRAEATQESREAIREARSETEAAREATEVTRRALSEAEAEVSAAREATEATKRALSEADTERSAAREASGKWRAVEIAATLRGQRVGNFVAWLLFSILAGLTGGAALHSILDVVFDLVLVGWLQSAARVVAGVGILVGFFSLLGGASLLSVRQSVSEHLAQWIRDKLIRFSAGESRSITRPRGTAR